MFIVLADCIRVICTLYRSTILDCTASIVLCFSFGCGLSICCPSTDESSLWRFLRSLVLAVQVDRQLRAEVGNRAIFLHGSWVWTIFVSVAPRVGAC